MVETMSFNTEMVYITWMISGNYIHFMNFDETPKWWFTNSSFQEHGLYS